MSVFAGRLYIVVTGGVLVACTVWLTLALTVGGMRSGAVVAPVVIGLIAGVALVVGVPLFAAFGEASIDDHALVVRSVLRRRRVALADITDAVALDALQLPSRIGGASVQRLLIHTRSGRRLAFTPRDTGLVARLREHDIAVTVDTEARTPGQAARRHPGAVAPAERAFGPLLWAAVVIPVVVVIWIVVDALR